MHLDDVMSVLRLSVVIRMDVCHFNLRLDTERSHKDNHLRTILSRLIALSLVARPSIRLPDRIAARANPRRAYRIQSTEAGYGNDIISVELKNGPRGSAVAAFEEKRWMLARRENRLPFTSVGHSRSRLAFCE